MSSCYIKCNTCNVHNSYAIAIDDVDEDEKFRDMIFNVLKNEVD